MNYEIVTRGVMAYIDQIQKLADRHSVTLSFISAKAYHQFAHDNHLYCAIKDEHVIAYVLFRYNKKTNKIVLVHVCVDDSHTKSGVAKALIELVIQQNPLAHLIEARCRRDYNLDDFWKQCGFHVTNEKPGRSLAGTHLKIWQRKIQTLDMLYLVQKAEAAKKLVAVLDTNIIIELCDDPTGNASCLYEASIADYVTYQITPECLDEISLKADVNSRKKHLEFVNRYSCTASSLLDKDLTPSLMERFDPLGSHKADIRHLAHCIDASVDVFVTNDKWICNLRETLTSKYVFP